MAQTSLNSEEITEQASGRQRLGRDYRVVAVCACAASVASFFWVFFRGELLLYGDAVAHINIARRVFDSRTPGADQLGSVWLPLPHVLSIPFIMNDWMWRTGVGGSIPSMIAYVFAVVGVFRLVRGRALPAPTSRQQACRGPRRMAAWTAAALLGLNPNLLYMQSTGMTESIFLAEVIWAVVYFDEFVRGCRGAGPQNDPTLTKSGRTWGTLATESDSRLSASKALERCGMVLAAAILTRYDGWVLAFVIGCAAIAVVLWNIRQFPQGLKPASLLTLDGAAKAAPLQRDTSQRTDLERKTLRRNSSAASSDQSKRAGARESLRGVWRALAAFLLLCVLTPTLWLAHNYAINYKPLDWWNGPYSAQAIEARTGHGFPYPGKHDFSFAAKLFLKAARLNFSSGFAEQRTLPSVAQMSSEWQTWMLALAALGTLLAVLVRGAWSWLLLWLPLPFYAYSIAYGSVPVFLPVWWPFSYYNVRYGLELLPAFAVFAAVATAFMVERAPAGLVRRAAAGVLLALLATDYVRVALATPICLREARVNSVTRIRLEEQLAPVLAGLPANSTLLMYTGDDVGALQSAGVRLRRVVSESTRMVWDAGLSCPAQVADYVIAVDGDPVGQAVAGNPRWLEKIAAFSTPGKPDVTVYRSRFPGRR